MTARRHAPTPESAATFGAAILGSAADAPLVQVLGRVSSTSSVLEAIRLAPADAALAAATARRSPSHARAVIRRLTDAVGDDTDAVTGLAAVHALAAIPGITTDAALKDVLMSGRDGFAAHAAWAIDRRPPALELLDPLVDLLKAGGLAGMHAQQTLARWARLQPWLVTGSLRRGLGRAEASESRHHVVETLGLVPGALVQLDLETLAIDGDEADRVRLAAVAALGDRADLPIPRAVAALAGRDDRIGRAAQLALRDRAEMSAPREARAGRGLRMFQVHLGAGLDADLLRSGMGDTGGIATLLVKLGSALIGTSEVREVVTVGRGTTGDVLRQPADPVGGHRFAAVALAAQDASSFDGAWPARVEAERGIRRVIRRHGRPDVMHLRMADAGTLAASNVAASLGIPTVFSLAPDPHALIAAREVEGTLDRRSFGREDAAFNYWYRADLVERLARHAQHVALFPRQRLTEQLRTLVGIDVAARPGGFTVVPEGIDVAQVNAALARRAGTATPESPAVAALLDRVSAGPPRRRGLPIVLSVGRLTELKGMGRLVDAFAADPALRARATLVIVGGDLRHPTPAEATELDHIQATVAANPGLGDAVILLGHRPHAEVVALLAAVRHGVDGLVGVGGAYACASRKEEFGLAIVEALAAGLPVVAPLSGGPSTYVEQGRTGLLVDTGDPEALGAGIEQALDLAGRPGRAEQATATVAARYDIAAMARAMAQIYRRVDASAPYGVG